MIQIVATALLYTVFAVYGDDSCIEMTFDTQLNCRVGAPTVWCPTLNGPCVARDRALQADVLWPQCSAFPPPSDPLIPTP